MIFRLIDIVSLIYFCFYCLCVWCHIHQIITKTIIIWHFPFIFFKFYISGLTFKSVIYSELIFMYGERNFFLFPMGFQPSHHYFTNLWTDYPFPILYSWYSCTRSVAHLCGHLFLGPLFCSIGLKVCIHASTILLWLL
jgi:hypothetical protein